MTSKRTETWYHMNLAGFEKLITHISAMGKTYNPSRASIKLNTLNKLREDAIRVMAESRNQAETHIKTLNERIVLTKTLRKLTPQITEALTSKESEQAMPGYKEIFKEAEMAKQGTESSDSPLAPEIVLLINTLNRDHLNPFSTNEAKPQSIREWFSKQSAMLIDLTNQLEKHKDYTPGEEGVSPQALRMLAEEMAKKNEEIAAAGKSKQDSELQKKQLFYQTGNGLVDIANSVKEYIKNEFSPDDQSYKAIEVIQFKTPSWPSAGTDPKTS